MAFNEPTTKTPPQVTEGTDAEAERPKWPGWPGDIVYRLIVPVIKVGSIIGRKGECIKKLCEETGARVRVLDGPITSSHRIVSPALSLRASVSFLIYLVTGLCLNDNGVIRVVETGGIVVVAQITDDMHPNQWL